MDSFKSKQIIYKDGLFYDSALIGMDYSSQTIHYGFGAFDGIRSYLTNNGLKLFKAQEHFERLKYSCEQIHLPFLWDVKELVADTYKLLEKNNLKNAYVRPLVYAESGMSMVNAAQSHIVLIAWQWDSFYGDKLLKACVSDYQKPDAKSIPVQSKISGNYINSTLAISKAKRNGFDEAILLDKNGLVTESTSANIFIERNGKLYTPNKGNIFSGITRATVLSIAKQLDIEVFEKDITVEELKNADAAFVCGTAVEIIGLKSIDNVIYPLLFSDTLGASIQRVYKNLVLDKLSFEVII